MYVYIYIYIYIFSRNLFQEAFLIKVVDTKNTLLALNKLIIR